MRLAAHPVISEALAAGELSESWARQLCEWTDRLPEGSRWDADEILTGAARAGADLAGLGGLAQEIYERSHRDGTGDDPGGRFDGRAVWLGVTFGGAGRLTGDLTPGCSAASGPGGLAARLRATLDGKPLTSASLPLDIGAATETIPAHLRRAVTTRHNHCAFPGCDQPASVCDIHHIVPRCRGGPTALHNLVPLCGFHHLTVIHRWGWRLILHADGSTTATSPDGRNLHSHGPPGRAA